MPLSSCLGMHCTGHAFSSAHVSQKAELGPVLDLNLSSCSGTAMPGKKVPVKEASFQVWPILDAILVCKGATCSVLSKAVAADTRKALIVSGNNMEGDGGPPKAI